MKASKFTEAQIAFVLKQAQEAHRLRKCVGRPVSPTRPSTIGARSMPG